MELTCFCCGKTFRGKKGQLYCSKKHGQYYRRYGQIQNHPKYDKWMSDFYKNAGINKN